MTVHGTYEWVRVMVPSPVHQRLGYAISRERLDRGVFLELALKLAIEASERGEFNKGDLTND